jgi:DNA mismatch endonuclease (patch repair protein)
VAVYVDGCFWHFCPKHGTIPASNASFWNEKLTGNHERDKRVTRELSEQGWLVLRFWEHDDPTMVAETIERMVRERRPDQPRQLSPQG